tara:strand:+ start:973 stop:1128 length:156 start_codon:yes stop_codon:yes gene_type:complete
LDEGKGLNGLFVVIGAVEKESSSFPAEFLNHLHLIKNRFGKIYKACDGNFY